MIGPSVPVRDTLLIFDHRFRKLQVVANICLDDYPDAAAGYHAARERIDTIIEALRKPRTVAPFSLMTTPPEAESSMST